MDYDSWKLESPEDEDECINGASRRRQAKAEWEEEHADYLREDRESRRLDERDDDE